MLQKLKGENLTSLTIMSLRMGSLVAKFVLTIFIARFMGLTELGTYGLIAGVTAILPVVTSLGLMNTLSRDAVGQSKTDIALALRNYWGLMIVIYLTLTAVLTLASFSSFLPFALPLVLLVMAITFLEHLNQDAMTLLINLRRPLLANSLMFIRAGAWIFLFMLLAFFVPALRHLDALLAFWLGFLVLCMAGFFVLARGWDWRKAFQKKLKWQWVTTEVYRARHLYLSNLSYNFNQYADRFMIAAALGVYFTGVYVFFWQFANGIFALVSVGVMAINRPHFIEAFNKKDFSKFWALYPVYLRRIVMSTLGLSFLTLAAVYLLLPYINTDLPRFYTLILIILLAATLVRLAGDSMGTVIMSTRHDKMLFQTNILFIPVSATLLGLVYLTHGGIIEVAACALLSSIIVGLYRIKMVKKIYRKHPPK